MAIDKRMLAEAQEGELKQNGQVLKAKDFKSSPREFRPLPNIHNELDGIWYKQVNTWWFNKKAFVAATTFNKDAEDVILEEIETAKEWLKDKTNANSKLGQSVLRLLNSKEGPKLSSSFIFAALLFNEYGANVVNAKVSAAKLIEGPRTFIAAINSIAISKNADNNTENGIMDREKGYNLAPSVTGEGIETKYNVTLIAQSVNVDIDEEWYTEKKVPSVMDYLKKRKKSDAFLRASIRHFLWNEPEPTEENDVDVEEDQTPAPTAAPPAKKEAPKPEKPAEAAPAPPASSRAASDPTQAKGFGLAGKLDEMTNDMPY